MAETVNKTGEKNDDYIDVAKNADYQNQSKEYYREFLNWRSSGNNPYAYYFVRRKSEHSYVDGKGYVSISPEDTEKKVLKRCCRLIAMTMLTFVIFGFLEIFYASMYTGEVTLSLTKVLSTERYDLYDVPLSVSSAVCGIRTMKYAVPILIFILDTKIPKAVFLPKEDKKFSSMKDCAIVMALMTASFCRIANDGLSAIGNRLGIGVYGFDYIGSSDFASTFIFGFVNCIVISALTEVLFRGLILQTMRQFGDVIAFVICCVAEVFSSFDFMGFGYSVCLGIVITLFTLRTGSIRTAIGMRISATSLFFILDIMKVYLDKSYAGIAANGVCFIIIAISLVIYSRITLSQNFSFNVNNSKTHLSVAKKLSIFFSHSGIMLWLIIDISVAVFAIRFV